MSNSLLNLQLSIEANTDQIIAWRRHFRKHPELSGQEKATQKKLLDILGKMGLSPRKAAGTGIVADIVGGRAASKIVALRADMDALPVEDQGPESYRSCTSGICHACGHDGHMAGLLGAAAALVQQREQLSGTVRLLFQPCEENFPSGAQALIDEGALEGVSAIVGLHLWQPLPAGMIAAVQGPVMASPDAFEIIVQGKGGHASMPFQTVDALAAGAQIAVALRGSVSAVIDPLEPAVLALGMLQAGDAFNVIPGKAVLKGTIRSFSQSVRETLFQRLEQVCRGICEAEGAAYVLKRIYGHDPVVNEPAVTAIVAQEAAAVAGAENVKRDFPPVMVGEDFSCYLAKVPGTFLLVGAGNEGKGISFPHHHPRFDIDEAALPIGAAVLARSAWTLLEKT